MDNDWMPKEDAGREGGGKKKKYKKYPVRQSGKDINADIAEEKSKTDKPMTPARKEALLTRTRNILLYSLENSPKTRSQLETRLKEKNIPDDIAKEVLDRYEEVELVNDPLFAKMWVGARQRSRSMAKGAIKYELKQKGISEEDIETALAEITPEDERERALEFVRKKAPSTRHLDKTKRTARLVGQLARKGYPSSIIFSVIKEVLGEEIEIAEE